MIVNDFYKDLKKHIKSNPESEKTIKAYNAGYITLNDAIKEILRGGNNDR